MFNLLVACCLLPLVLVALMEPLSPGSAGDKWGGLHQRGHHCQGDAATNLQRRRLHFIPCLQVSHGVPAGAGRPCLQHVPKASCCTPRATCVLLRPARPTLRPARPTLQIQRRLQGPHLGWHWLRLPLGLLGRPRRHSLAQCLGGRHRERPIRHGLGPERRPGTAAAGTG
jgi:hypothetical protein